MFTARATKRGNNPPSLSSICHLPIILAGTRVAVAVVDIAERQRRIQTRMTKTVQGIRTITYVPFLTRLWINLLRWTWPGLLGGERLALLLPSQSLFEDELPWSLNWTPRCSMQWSGGFVRTLRHSLRRSSRTPCSSTTSSIPSFCSGASRVKPHINQLSAHPSPCDDLLWKMIRKSGPSINLLNW